LGKETSAQVRGLAEQSRDKREIKPERKQGRIRKMGRERRLHLRKKSLTVSSLQERENWGEAPRDIRCTETGGKKWWVFLVGGKCDGTIKESTKKMPWGVEGRTSTKNEQISITDRPWTVSKTERRAMS